MTILELSIRLAGAALLALGVSHVAIPKHFGWAEELKAISPLTRQIHFVHNAFIGLLLVLQGLLCLLLAHDLLQKSRLAAAILGGLAFFWGVRLLVQLFVYSGDHWRGKRFETWMHILFGLFWAYLTVVFGWGLAIQLG